MTQKAKAKGPKFETMKSVKAPAENGVEKGPFEVKIPPKVRDLLLKEQKIANDAINAYIAERQKDFKMRTEIILTTFRATCPDVPAEFVMKANDDFTKLVKHD